MSLRKKLETISRVLLSVEKQFGRGALMRWEEEVDQPVVEVVATGSLGLDRALGVGGWPRGRLIEMYGPEGSGKSTLALHAVRECQQQGGIAAYIDAEHALDLKYAKAIGVKVGEVLLSQPDTGEQGLEVVDMLARSGAVDFVVVDSVAALIPQAELEGEIGDIHAGLQARLISQALRKLVGVIAKTSTTVLFLNQLRHKIGATFGSPEITPGGNALKFFASIRVDIRCIGQIKEGTQITGHRLRARIVKNKLAVPFQEAEFEIRYGQGINSVAEWLDWGVATGHVEKSGSWFSFQDTILGQGHERACHNLQQQPALFGTLQRLLRPIKEEPNTDSTEEEIQKESPPAPPAPSLSKKHRKKRKVR